MTNKEIFQKSIERIKSKGWRQGGGDRRDPNACLCALDTMHAVAGMDPESFDAATACANAFRQAIDEPSIWIWNDHFDRVQEDVIAAFERAIELEDLAVAKQGG